MTRSKTKNDRAWEQLFDKYDILNQINKKGSYLISSKQINDFREARLMTKFDHSNNLPKIFKSNGISILPVSRGDYVMGRFKAYAPMEVDKCPVTKVTYPSHIESIDFDNITSEATAINVAYISKIIDDFIGEEGLLPTVDGRMRSESFSYRISDTLHPVKREIQVVNSQIEIDGGYESENSLTLIEAKNSLSDDFLVRQVYYPYRLWSGKISKKINNIYLTYSNGIFRLSKYDFIDDQDYNSLELVKQKSYSFDSNEIYYQEIEKIIKNVEIKEEPKGIPFPQADDFNRIINLFELLYENESLTKDEITTNYDFDSRQSNYYTDAGRYLGIIKKDKDEENKLVFKLTEKGYSLFSKNIKERNLAFAKLILEQKAFNEVARYEILLKKNLSKGDIVQIMLKSNIYNVTAKSTYYRRASTIRSWVAWIKSLIYI